MKSSSPLAGTAQGCLITGTWFQLILDPHGTTLHSYAGELDEELSLKYDNLLLNSSPFSSFPLMYIHTPVLWYHLDHFSHSYHLHAKTRIRSINSDSHALKPTWFWILCFYCSLSVTWRQSSTKNRTKTHVITLVLSAWLQLSQILHNSCLDRPSGLRANLTIGIWMQFMQSAGVSSTDNKDVSHLLPDGCLLYWLERFPLRTVTIKKKLNVSSKI